jgi:nucleoredoxin
MPALSGAFLAHQKWMQRGLVCFFLLSFAFLAAAAQLPMTAKEVGLMLRTGYSNSAVIRELSVRHFADALDEAKEKTLVQAGASAELITLLKSGTYSLSPEQSALAQQQITDLEKRRAAAAGESKKFDTLYQHERIREQAEAARQRAKASFIHELVKGDLVYWHYGSLAHFDDEALGKKKLIALYFSAHWCGPCRKFTPQLVEYYNQVEPQHPEFEIVFVSSDRSQFAMETYMRETNMPWPAIDFQKLGGQEAIKKYAGSGIPCLVLVDATGKVLSDSFAGTQYLGPQKVLSDLDTIFAGNAAPHIAATR